MRVAGPTLNITTLPAPPRPAATSLHRSPFPLRRDGHAPEPQLLLHGVLQSQRPPPQPVAVRPCSPRCVSLHVPVERLLCDVITSAKLLSRQTTRFEITD